MIIETDGLTKTYRMGSADVHALRAVDLRVAAGEGASFRKWLQLRMMTAWRQRIPQAHAAAESGSIQSPNSKPVDTTPGKNPERASVTPPFAASSCFAAMRISGFCLRAVATASSTVKAGPALETPAPKPEATSRIMAHPQRRIHPISRAPGRFINKIPITSPRANTHPPVRS